MATVAPGIWRVMPGETIESGRASGHEFRRVVLRYAISGLAVLILLSAAAVYVLQTVSRDEAIRNARDVAEVTGHGIVEPNITRAVMRGDATALARLDRIVRRGVLQGRVVRVKVWEASGRIVYSDEKRLIGAHYSLGEDERASIVTGKTDAEVSDLTRPENRFERRFQKLLEVYLPIHGPNGRPLLFETYERYSAVAASSRELWLAFAPAILGALALLWLIQLPFAWRGARQLRENQADRERLLQRAIDSSELERRRIARDLHDGAVQDLAGVSYSLTAAARHSMTAEETEDALREAATGTRRAIRELRSLLVDIYPPDLHRTGLGPALQDLVAPLAPRGIAANIEAPNDLTLPPAVETLFYRCAQEALRNVVKHSGATRVDVSVTADDHVARLVVRDNGHGFDAPAADGHLGLRVLSDLADEAGGALKLDSLPEGGARVCIEAPL